MVAGITHIGQPVDDVLGRRVEVEIRRNHSAGQVCCGRRLARPAPTSISQSAVGLWLSLPLAAINNAADHRLVLAGLIVGGPASTRARRGMPLDGVGDLEGAGVVELSGLANRKHRAGLRKARLPDAGIPPAVRRPGRGPIPVAIATAIAAGGEGASTAPLLRSRRPRRRLAVK